ncbi:unnamed protein product [Penicillium egyptiacum]|uniref:Uncharacterized protein n=1 Tax=Penicillium egyptiacum TaxID=1303716 RepID=A0A9W4P7H9_9EURO|nr:unnamed protein product [Penicillium egyptiacum]
MEAVIILSSITFVIAVGAVIIQGRYRIHLHVTSKTMTPPRSLDLEIFDPDESTHVQPPPKLHRHSRLGSRNSRWPGYTERRGPPSRIMADHFTSYRVPDAETGTSIHHFPHPPPNLPATFTAPVARATTPSPATEITPPEAPTANPT